MDKRKTGNESARLIREEIEKVFSGKEEKSNILILALFAGLHVLIEDVPGVGKTTLAKCLAGCCGMDFGRIQFTPDLLPGDITGMTIWDPIKREFVFRPGGVMHELLLADEINRATARTQSALLEAMEERTVTVDGRTLNLPETFLVIATQNPVEFMGTFTLPEAQVDRFGISFSLGYPDDNTETRILDLTRTENPLEVIDNVITPGEIIEIQKTVRNIHAEEEIKKYIIRIADASRRHEYLRLGLSPRGAAHLFKASCAAAFIAGRDYIIPEDVIDNIIPVIRHRLLLSPTAGFNNLTVEQIIEEIISNLPVPTGIK